jgi:signal transduction histidine kinase/CheY-like chemotaxis protein
MRQWAKRSVRNKVMAVVLATTFAALMLAGIAMVVYELRTYEKSRAGEIGNLANILARVCAPALAFDDPKVANENLDLLKTRPMISAAAIYKPNGRVFAVYPAHSQSLLIPATPEKQGYRIEGNQLLLFQPIVENKEVIGTLYLQGLYEPLERLKDYLTILGGVMLASMALAFLISAWLQGTVTRPLLAITAATRHVRERRDYSSRASKSTDDEIGELVEAFNDMLSEVGERTSALEQTNRSLKHEMQERREAEDALLEADKRKDEFLATLAHELRNPLAPLRNGLEIMQMRGATPEAIAKSREMMHRQLKQMVRLVDDLLDVSRITTGKLAVRKEPVSLQLVMRNAIETVRPFIESRRHVMELDVPSQPIPVLADPTRLAQVFSNLLNNAAKYSEQGGRIRFGVAVEGKIAAVSVTDNGIGIEPAMLPAIFTMFTQVDRSLERTQAGLGVGLSLAKRLVELHDGTIEASSEGLAKGSRFVVRLPIVEIPSAGATPATATPTPNQASAYRILLADDNADFANSMALLLRAKGHEVRVTHNGADALKEAGSFQPQFAFLDIGMPILNGYELAENLRRSPETKDVVLTAITGWGQENDRRRAERAGFHHHLVKPVDINALEGIIAAGPNH